MYEHFFTCPHCWEEISMLIDTSVPHQKYVEDCEICCNPIDVIATCEDGELVAFDAISLEQ